MVESVSRDGVTSPIVRLGWVGCVLVSPEAGSRASGGGGTVSRIQCIFKSSDLRRLRFQDCTPSQGAVERR